MSAAFTVALASVTSLDWCRPLCRYSQSFVPNSGVDEKGNTFDPSNGRQWEVGVKYQPSGFEGLFTIDISISRRRMSSNISRYGFAVATGEIASRGLELEGKVSLGGGWDFVGSYTYTMRRSRAMRPAMSGNARCSC